MVIHEENDFPVEVATITETNLLSSKNCVLKQNSEDNEGNCELNTDFLNMNCEDNTKTTKKLKGKRKKSNKCEQEPCSDEDNTNAVTEISKSDLLELKTIYEKCKSVMKKIETKYGHLLDIDDSDSSSKRKRKNKEYEEECRCTLNKKIVFDDEGKEVLKEPVLENHICPKRIKHVPIESENRNIQVEYEQDEIILPSSLIELQTMLQDTQLDMKYRSKVIDKIRFIRQEYSNEIRFNKPSLVEQLKTNADETLDFKGTNLSSLPGYS